jgi:hypothetical protein
MWTAYLSVVLYTELDFRHILIIQGEAVDCGGFQSSTVAD